MVAEYGLRITLIIEELSLALVHLLVIMRMITGNSILYLYYKKYTLE